MAKWTAAGKTVVQVLATRGEAGIDSMDPAECARIRTEERSHKLYFDNLGADFDPGSFLTGMAEQTGAAAGVAHAIAFELLRL